MNRFILKMSVLSVVVAFSVKALSVSAWNETILFETLGSALGLVFFSALLSLGLFYVFLYWKFKKFDENSYQNISWGIWGVFVVSMITSSFIVVP